MSEPARQTIHMEVPSRAAQPGPLRDWLAAIRTHVAETPPAAPAPAPVEAKAPEERPAARPARFVPPAAAQQDQDDEVAEIVAENMMLKAKLRLEGDRYDELQVLLAQEVRELREHIREEIENLDDMRAERDLWKARCEALMQPLFQKA